MIASKNSESAARQLARILDVPWAAASFGPFMAVHVNDGLTIDFDQWTDDFPKSHYCFRVSEDEFDALLGRLIEMGIAYRSLPHGPVDGRINTSAGGRIVYWSEPDGHVWEALTQSYARAPAMVPRAARDHAGPAPANRAAPTPDADPQ